MILPMDMWEECIKCPHCYDDDEALYCDKLERGGDCGERTNGEAKKIY